MITFIEINACYALEAVLKDLFHCLPITLFVFAITSSMLQDNGKNKPAQIVITLIT